MILSISWKNIWRNKSRSLVVITALTLGLFGGLFCAAFFEGMADRRVEEALSKEIAHIQIHHPKFIENPEIDFTIPNVKQVLASLEARPEVIAAASRLKFNAMVASSSSNTGTMVIGVDPEKEKQISQLYTALLSKEEIAEKYETADSELIEEIRKDSVGAYFENVSRNPVFIGEELAKKLKVKVRSKIVLTFQNSDGSLTGGAFRVCGIFRLENSLFEESNVFVRQKDIIDLVGLPAESSHEIALTLVDENLAVDVANSIQDEFPAMEVSDWKEIQPDIAMLNDMMQVSMTIIMIIVLLALGFGIVNTMLMVVLERVKELGMLMAIGMQRMKIFFMIILESVLLCLTGAALGMGLSILVVETLKTRGLDMTAFIQEGIEAMGIGAVFYPSLSAAFYVEVTLLVIITGILSSVYPAWKALKLNPADALRSE